MGLAARERVEGIMDSVDIEVLKSAEAWRKAGHRVALGTIVKTWGSAPRPVGAMVAIRDDGHSILLSRWTEPRSNSPS